MTDMHDNGGPAFPNIEATLQAGDMLRFQPGMTLRDWFAGQALAGIASNCDASGLNGWSGLYGEAATTAFAFADAMLEARK